MKSLVEKAEVLIEALPYLQQFRGALVVVKYGGAAMIEDALADSWARDVVLLEHVGLQPLVVHGGGPALTRTMQRMGLTTEFVDGHRVTSAESAEVAEMVLSGRINKQVVSRLQRAGGQAVGLSGTDAGMLRVSRHRPSGRDIGFVGDIGVLVETLNAFALDDLEGFVPTVIVDVAHCDTRARACERRRVGADAVAHARGQS